MKRHPGLAPLSREHHDGLLLAARLQQGRNALLRLWSHDPRWQAEFVVKFFEDHLAAHFATEEEIMFPPGAGLPGLRPVVEELLAEHEEMRAIVSILREPDEKKLECSLARFGQVLEHHIRTEERVFFPRCEAEMTEAQLDAMTAAIGARHGGLS